MIRADEIKVGDSYQGMLVQKVGWTDRDGHLAVRVSLYGVASGRRRTLTLWPDQRIEVERSKLDEDPFKGL